MQSSMGFLLWSSGKKTRLLRRHFLKDKEIVQLAREFFGNCPYAWSFERKHFASTMLMKDCFSLETLFFKEPMGISRFQLLSRKNEEPSLQMLRPFQRKPKYSSGPSTTIGNEHWLRNCSAFVSLRKNSARIAWAFSIVN